MPDILDHILGPVPTSPEAKKPAAKPGMFDDILGPVGRPVTYSAEELAAMGGAAPTKRPDSGPAADGTYSAEQRADMSRDPLDHILGPVAETKPADAKVAPAKAGIFDDLLGPIGQPKTTHNWLSGAAMSVGQGATFNGLDEVLAGLKTGGGFAGNYESERKRILDDHAAWERDNPWASTIAKGVGAIGSAIALPSTLGRVGLTKLATMYTPRFAAIPTVGGFAKEGTRLGALYGAPAGFLGAEPEQGSSYAGALTDRVGGGVKEAAIGGLVGGGLGGLTGAASQIAPKAMATYRAWGDPKLQASQRLMRDFMDSSGGDLDIARKLIDVGNVTRKNGTKALPQDQIDAVTAGLERGESAADIAKAVGINPATVRNYATRYADEVAPMVEGATIPERLRLHTGGTDVENVKLPYTEIDNGHRAAVRYTGAARMESGKALLQRQIEADSRIQEQVRKTFGTTGDFINERDAARDAFKAEAKKRYDLLNESTASVPMTPQLDRLLKDPLVQPAIKMAMESAARTGKWELSDQALGARSANQIQKYLRAQAKQAWRNADPLAEDLSMLHGNFMSQVADKHTGFREIQSWYARQKSLEAVRNAAEGISLNNPSKKVALLPIPGKAMTGKANATVADIVKHYGKDDEVMDLMRQSFGHAVNDAIGAKRATHDLAGPFMTRHARDMVNSVLKPKDGERFLLAMRREREMTASLQFLFGNSHTADLLAKFQQNGEVANIGADALSGNWLQAARGVARSVARKQTEKAGAAQAQILSETNPAEIRRLLTEMHKTISQYHAFNPTQNGLMQTAGAFAAPAAGPLSPALGALLPMIINGIPGNTTRASAVNFNPIIRGMPELAASVQAMGDVRREKTTHRQREHRSTTTNNPFVPR